jgi:hypothetical protein
LAISAEQPGAAVPSPVTSFQRWAVEPGPVTGKERPHCFIVPPRHDVVSGIDAESYGLTILKGDFGRGMAKE